MFGRADSVYIPGTRVRECDVCGMEWLTADMRRRHPLAHGGVVCPRCYDAIPARVPPLTTRSGGGAGVVMGDNSVIYTNEAIAPTLTSMTRTLNDGLLYRMGEGGAASDLVDATGNGRTADWTGVTPPLGNFSFVSSIHPGLGNARNHAASGAGTPANENFRHAVTGDGPDALYDAPQITAMAWVRWNGDQINDRLLVLRHGQSTTASNARWAFGGPYGGVDPSTIDVLIDGSRVGDSSASGFVESVNIVLTAGTWYHVALTHDTADNQVRIYVDGVLRNRATKTRTTTALASLALNVWGGSTATAGADAALDDVRVRPVIMTAAEILAVYNAGVAGTSYVLETVTGVPALTFSVGQITSAPLVTLTGTRFNRHSRARIDANIQPTTYVSDTSLTFTWPAQYRVASTYALDVQNLLPLGATGRLDSNDLTVTVTA